MISIRTTLIYGARQSGKTTMLQSYVTEDTPTLVHDKYRINHRVWQDLPCDFVHDLDALAGVEDTTILIDNADVYKNNMDAIIMLSVHNRVVMTATPFVLTPDDAYWLYLLDDAAIERFELTPDMRHLNYNAYNGNHPELLTTRIFGQWVFRPKTQKILGGQQAAQDIAKRRTDTLKAVNFNHANTD